MIEMPLCPMVEWGGAHDVDFLRLRRFKRAATYAVFVGGLS
jgi:hypothetical protein